MYARIVRAAAKLMPSSNPSPHIMDIALPVAGTIQRC
jgi:hypothetical protein